MIMLKQISEIVCYLLNLLYFVHYLYFLLFIRLIMILYILFSMSKLVEYCRLVFGLTIILMQMPCVNTPFLLKCSTHFLIVLYYLIICYQSIVKKYYTYLFYYMNIEIAQTVKLFYSLFAHICSNYNVKNDIYILM